ncbi:MAG: sulfatase-like hydrolase/transferase, partial [Firmicutes bacterium]|nr:sulfatase-like hydrolase/transferase [Bacillota bacterium]
MRALGDASVHTPVLDGLAQRGTVYRNVHTMGGYNAAVCSPSRASLLTGRQVFRSLTWPHQDALVPDAVTLPQWFREHGWHTFETGKWHHDHASFQRSFCAASAIYFGGMYHHVGVPVFDYDAKG